MIEINKIKKILIAFGIPTLIIGVVAALLKIPVVHQTGMAMVIIGGLGLMLGVVLAKMTRGRSDHQEEQRRYEEGEIIDVTTKYD